MTTPPWLRPSLILLDTPADTVADVVRATASAAAVSTGADAALADLIEEKLRRATEGGGYAVGGGVAVPHADIPGLDETTVALVRTSRPLPVQALDAQPADVFFVILSRPNDPRGHLLLLAHLARLARSRVLVDGLRQVQTAADAAALIEAAELRHTATATPVSTPAATHYLALISVAGEKTVDALLVTLLDQHFGDASILEAQSLRDAATREVPLFAGFRDIFGDPGGQRVLLLELPADRIDALSVTVRRVFEECKPAAGSFSLVPLQSRWTWTPPRAEKPARGH
jgi:PTS system nitrogen regulatory IIA component